MKTCYIVIKQTVTRRGWEDDIDVEYIGAYLDFDECREAYEALALNETEKNVDYTYIQCPFNPPKE